MKPKFKINQKVWLLNKGKLESGRISSLSVLAKSHIKGDFYHIMDHCGPRKETEFEIETTEIKYGVGLNGYDRPSVPEFKIFKTKEDLKAHVTKWANNI